MADTHLSLKQTGRFTKLILDFVNQAEKLRPFYGLEHTLENYPQKISERKGKPIDRELLVNSLHSQYKSSGVEAEGLVKENIDSLLNENCFTVTTGHQLNIFTGPLYFVYKILHTIKLSDELNVAYPDSKFVPIYWMNSEDHDIDEVGQFNLFGKKYNWETKQTGATGKMSPIGLSGFVETLKESFANSPDTLELVKVFENAYSNFKNLSEATRYFANALFSERGLVIIDSDDRSLKTSFTEFFEKDIFSSEPYNLVRSTNDKLLKADYGTQVNPREINCFYLVDGVRNRIVTTQNGFHVLNTDIRFSESELREEIHSNPQRFSPNVVLRPLFQEFILPNLTYVGGAGELAYWLQYGSYFQTLEVSFPMLCLRNHFLLLTKAQTDRLNKFAISEQELFKSADDLIRKFVEQSADTEIRIEDELKLAEDLYNKLQAKAELIDPTLEASIEADKVKLIKGLAQWKGRFTRSLKQQNEVSVNQIKKLHRKLFPEDYLQERYANFLEFYTQSPETFFDTIYNSTEPFKTEFTITEV